MDEKTFWSLGLYDWTLWVEKIKSDRIKEEMQWVRISHIKAIIAEVNRNPKSRASAYEPGDFYRPSWEVQKVAEEEKRTNEEILAKFRDIKVDGK